MPRKASSPVRLPAEAGRSPAGAARPVSPERAAELKQSEQFARASALFRQGKFGMARRVLEKVQAGPNSGLGHRAGVYIAICRQRTARKRPRLETVEEHYNAAVRLVNDGEFDEAVRVCNRGLAKDASAAHLHYIKAVAKVLAGQRTGAVAPLKKAISLDPSIRRIARRDPDMASVVRTHPFAKLIAE